MATTRRQLIRRLSALAWSWPFADRFGFANPSASPKIAPSAPDLTLWYDEPAARWIDALPLGNGRLGAMVFGGGEDGVVNQETVALNDDTFWSGRPRDGNNPAGTKAIEIGGLSKLSPCAPCWRVSLVEEGSTRIDVDESE